MIPGISVTALSDGAVPLQSCADALDCWAKAQFFDASLTALRNTGTIAVYTLLVTVPLYIGLWYWSRSHTLPIVTFLLMGGAMFPLLPAAAARIGWIIVLFAGGMGLFAIVWVVIR